MKEITQAVAVLQAGDPQGARGQLLKLWEEWSDTGGAMERCTIAHFLADTETEVPAELEWDLRALEAATGGRDSADREATQPELKGFLPSLHLNVGDAYRRLGDQERARLHAEMGLKHATALNDDPYGKTIREGLGRLLRRLNGDS